MHARTAFSREENIDFTDRKPFDLLAEGLRSAIWLPVVGSIRTWATGETGFILTKFAVLSGYAQRE